MTKTEARKLLRELRAVALMLSKNLDAPEVVTAERLNVIDGCSATLRDGLLTTVSVCPECGALLAEESHSRNCGWQAAR